ncbi:caspase family protein [uncultured Nostoc sp.]|uniref:caspase family protein n=1 Tax=uncultured Nostoc sp. TaxID=340711 RepID=UPI0035C98E9C
MIQSANLSQSNTFPLATPGLNQQDFLEQVNPYRQLLSQNTSRKLALLIGINNYPPGIRSLNGCLTDLEMQRELLIHRFGFNPQDIREVKDQKATRNNILAAFKEHLIQQAKPGDVVVFHFSGHGSRVIDPNPIDNRRLNSTLVPYDSATENHNIVRDIMGRTLFLLMSAIRTEYLTVILDCCHAGGGTRGNLVIRSARSAGGENFNACPEEFEYQQQWLTELKLSPEEFQRRREQGIANGVALSAAKDEQFATDAPFGDFSAGAFSYLLTRYLWQQTRNDAVGKVFINLALRTHDVAKSSQITQDPNLEVKPESNNEKQLLYFNEQVTLGAEGVIRNLKDDQIEFWLGGVASQTLESFQPGSIFSLIDNQGQEIGLIEQQSCVGLVGYGKVVQDTPPNVVQPGVLLRERVRGIPTNLTLKVGLDSSLGAEKAQAERAIETVRRIKVVPVTQQDVVHYLLGRITEDDFRYLQQQRIPDPPPVGAIGLFTAGRELVPDSFGRAGESVEESIQQRLRTRFKSLLAGRILQMLVTGESSSLKVTTIIQSVHNTATANIVSSRDNQEFQSRQFIQAVQFQARTNIQVQVENNETRNLYICIVLIDSSGDLIVLFPCDWDAPEDAALVSSGERITVPKPEDNFKFYLRGPSGILEVLVLASVKPVRNALRGLHNIARSRNVGRGVPLGLSEDEPVEVMESLLGDLNEMARASLDIISKEVQAVDMTQIVGISAMIEVVE